MESLSNRPRAPAAAPATLLLLLLTACAPAPTPTLLWFEQGDIERGQTLRIERALPQGSALLLELVQRDADLSLAVEAADGSLLAGPVDSGLFRGGRERLLLEPATDQPVIIVVRAGEDAAPAASYELRLLELPQDGAAAADLREGLSALNIAGTELARGTTASREAAEVALVRAVDALAAAHADAELADATYQLAMLRYIWFYRWEDSARLYREAASRYRDLSEDHLAAQALMWQGAALAETRELARADALVEHARVELEALGADYDAAFAINMRAYVATQAGNYEDSIAGYRAARDAFAALGESLREAQAQSNLAVDVMRAGRLHDAVVEIGRAAASMQGSDQQRLRAETLLNLAWVQAHTGDLAAARATYLETLAGFQAIDDASGVLYATSGLAWTYAQSGDSARAAELYEQVIAGSTAQDDGDLLLTSLMLSGNLLREAGDVAGARERHMAQRRGARGEAEQVNALLQLGSDDLAAGDPDAAMARLMQADAQLAPTTTAPILRMRLDLALAAAALARDAPGDAARAGAWAERAVAAADPLGRSDGTIEGQQLLARIAAQAGDPVAALAHAERALDALRDHRAQVPGGHLRWTYAGAQQPHYAEHVALLMDLADAAAPADRDALVARALAVSEEAHATALAEFIDGGRGPSVPTGAIRQRLAELRVRLDELPGDAAGERAALVAAISEQLLALDASWEASDWPVRRWGIGLTEIQALLTSRMDASGTAPVTLVEYLLGERRSYAWVVTADRMRSVRLAPRAVIEAASWRAYEALSRRRDGAAPEAALRELADLVIAPVLDAQRGGRLVVVADGALSLIPFDALPRPAGGALLDHLEVAHAASATVLSLLDDPDVGPRGIAVYAAPVGSADDARVVGLPPLPGASREVASIATMAGDHGWTVASRDGEAATLDALRADVRSRSVVHLATHGVLDLAEPRASGLLLSDAGTLRLIGPDELMALEVAAGLVVLSACDASVAGTADAGALSLAHSFVAAGAPRVISALWAVSDEATRQLMDGFYRHLLAGERPSAALRAAKLERRAAGSAIADWAAFEFIGTPTAFPEAR